VRPRGEDDHDAGEKDAEDDQDTGEKDTAGDWDETEDTDEDEQPDEERTEEEEGERTEEEEEEKEEEGESGETDGIGEVGKDKGSPIEFPHIMNCPDCDAKIKLNQAGKFRCPMCKGINEIDEFGSLMGIGGTGEGQENVKKEAIEFPIIIKCPDCEARIRVKQAGKFRCPMCENINAIDEYGSVGDGGQSRSREEVVEFDFTEEDLEEERREKEAEKERMLAELEYPFTAPCPGCSKKINITGPGTFKCGKCSTVFRAGPQKVQIFQCPLCRVKFKTSRIGKLKCPKCTGSLLSYMDGRIESENELPSLEVIGTDVSAWPLRYRLMPLDEDTSVRVFSRIEGVSHEIARHLHRAGYDTAEKLLHATPKELLKIKYVDRELTDELSGTLEILQDRMKE